jgi:XisI protein
MDTWKAIVKKAVEGYAVKGLNSDAYLTISPDENLLTVVDIAILEGQRVVATSLIVRIVNERIIIEHDDNNKPLVDALLQAGIPRNQIILAYAGEPVHELA